MKKAVCYFLFFFFCGNAFCQGFEPGKGRAVIYFESHTPVIVRLDSILLQQTKAPVFLKEGTYIVRAWAPTRKLLVDTISIRENKTTFCVKHLKPTEKYLVYKKDLLEYRFKKTIIFLPLPIALGISGAALKRVKDNKKIMDSYRRQADESLENYAASVSVDHIAAYGIQYEITRNEYNKYLENSNRLRTTACIAASAGVVATAALLYLTRKMVKPTYSETPLLTLESLGVDRDYNSVCSVTVTLNINR